jgi:hypothetical protein
MEGKVEIKYAFADLWENGYYIALDKQLLSVYKGISKDGEPLH